jgi:hypothetical protein
LGLIVGVSSVTELTVSETWGEGRGKYVAAQLSEDKFQGIYQDNIKKSI